MLGAIVGEEEAHQDFGWTYVREALRERPARDVLELRKLLIPRLESLGLWARS